MKSSQVKSCQLDPIPIWLHIDCAYTSIRILTTIVNMSLRPSKMPSQLKQIHVRPEMKKPNLDKDILNNYRPVSNLPYLSKKIEGVIVARLSAHISEYHLCERSLSAYKPNHSVEMALVFVQNDILRAMDNQTIVIVLLLDLSAAFDTVDHDAMLHRLSHDVGVSQTALDWCVSYLSNTVQYVHSNCSTSPASTRTCGVHQGSVLCPWLFSIYVAQLSKITRNNNFMSHCYADDTQIYTTVKPSVTRTLTRLFSALNSNRVINKNKLLEVERLKAEIIAFGSAQRLKKITQHELHLGDCLDRVIHSVRNSGVHFDAEITMESHVTVVCR